MKGTIEKEGYYELFETIHGHQILSLNKENWYSVIKGKKGDILVLTDANHTKKETLKKGAFYLAHFKDDPKFSDIPHLFLQEGNKFSEWILPNNRPTKNDYQKKLVKSGKMLSSNLIEYYLNEKDPKDTKQPNDRKKNNLQSKTKQELYRIAQKRDLKGRSKWNKKQLINNLEKTGWFISE